MAFFFEFRVLETGCGALDTSRVSALKNKKRWVAPQLLRKNTNNDVPFLSSLFEIGSVILCVFGLELVGFIVAILRR